MGDTQRRWVRVHAGRRSESWTPMNLAESDPLFADSYPYNGEPEPFMPPGGPASNKARTTAPGRPVTVPRTPAKKKA
jgi:hypothetical protein